MFIYKFFYLAKRIKSTVCLMDEADCNRTYLSLLFQCHGNQLYWYNISHYVVRPLMAVVFFPQTFTIKPKVLVDCIYAFFSKGLKKQINGRGYSCGTFLLVCQYVLGDI